MFLITQSGRKQKMVNRIFVRNPVKKYGMILENDVIEELKSNNAIAVYDNKQDIYYNLVFIVNIYVYAVSDKIDSYCEYNDSTKILSSANSFWITNEIEYKIETDTPIPIETIINRNPNEHFCFSKVVSQTCFERYYKYIQDSRCEYIDILGKKNWKRPMALKHKKLIDTEPILTRAVSLLPYSEKALNEYVNSLFEITLPISGKKLDVFYKKKKRAICIDENRGMVFGVSSSVSAPFSAKRRNLNQIEIEFWSSIIRSSDAGKMDYAVKIDYDSFFELIDWTKDKITAPYKAPGCTKVEWLEE